MSAFGGNQFEGMQKEISDSFFSTFYSMITAGKLVSTILYPIIRSNVKCFENDCYPLAFGISALILLIEILHNREAKKRKYYR